MTTRVSLSNLQRQIIHGTPDIGRVKAESAADTLQRINPHVDVIRHVERLDAANADALFTAYDMVVDGSDNFTTPLPSPPIRPSVWRSPL